jgi:F-type H+-transporting ATPase subunit b
MLKPMLAPLLSAAAGEKGGIMSVDTTLLWGTLVVFGLFSWILARYAWGPLLKIVGEREKAIREHVEGAERAAAEAKDVLTKHQEMLRAAGRERDQMLKDALKDAEKLRVELAEKARSEADRVVGRARDQIQREKEQAIGDLRAQVADIAVEAASRIVKSSLTREAQKKLVDEYIKELPSVRPERQA